MIFNRKKKEKLDESLTKLYPKYSYELKEKKERRENSIKRVKFIMRIILPFILSTVCLILFFTFAIVGTHETQFILPNGDIITSDIGEEIFLNGQKLEGIKINDNIVFQYASIGLFCSFTITGFIFLVKD